MPLLFLPPTTLPLRLSFLRHSCTMPLTPSKPAAASPTKSPTKSPIKSVAPPVEPTSATSSRRLDIFYSQKFKSHIPPRSHPECPARLDTCEKALKDCEHLQPLLKWIDPIPFRGERKEAVMPHIENVHDYPDYLVRLKSLAESERFLDMDTYLSKQSYDIAMLAASTWLQAVDRVMDDHVYPDPDMPRAAWALTRPPGHHATPVSGQGFCLLSNAAIAARYGVEKGLRVAILDFDVHHGNGTEAFVKKCEAINFVSGHQWPLYPGSGQEGVIGKFDNVKNVNFPAGTTMEIYRERYQNDMLPFLLKDDPELVVVSAGFDALDNDPLAGMSLQPEDYRELVEMLVEQLPNGKFVFGLEGGYHLGEGGIGEAIRECVMGFCCPR